MTLYWLLNHVQDSESDNTTAAGKDFSWSISIMTSRFVQHIQKETKICNFDKCERSENKCKSVPWNSAEHSLYPGGIMSNHSVVFSIHGIEPCLK